MVMLKKKVKRTSLKNPVLKKRPRIDWEQFRDEEIDEDEVLRSLCKESFYDFVKTMWGVVSKEKPVWNWHIGYICRLAQKAVENLIAGNDKLWDLLVNVPPGTSKSTILSVMLPAWVWTRMPECQFVCVSFRYPLALDLSRKCRDVVKSDVYRRLFPEVKIRKDQDSKHHFILESGGYRYCAGSGGDIIGRHAHIIVIDDPIDPKGTASEAELEAVNLWIEEELSSRKVDKDRTLTILVMQRLHMGDPSARMLSYATKLKHVKLPAVLEWEGVRLHTVPRAAEKKYKDGLLDPVRLTRKTLKETAKKPRGKYLVSGQYLQEPCLVAGTLVATDRGQVPIEDVTTEDLVHTRDGLKRVLWSGKTGDAETIVSVLFANGSVISGTPDHPVFTKNRGWVALDSIRRGDYTVVGQFPVSEEGSWAGRKGRTAKSCGSTESSTSAPPARRTSATASRGETGSTETCGGTATGTFPLAMTSTTKTRTLVTTTSAILSACPSGSTASDIARRELIESFLTASDTWGTPGTGRKRGGSSTASTGGKSSRNSGGMLSIPTTPAPSAVPGTGRGRKMSTTSSVPPAAKRKCGSASTAGSAGTVPTSSSPPSRGRSAAPGGVRTFGGGGKNHAVPVYDLTVEGCPEFFANGILVHNCPPGGGMFDTKKIVRLTHQESVMYLDPRLARKNLVRTCRFWDKAITEGGGAYTVGVKMALTRAGRIVILDVKRFQHDSWRREKKIKDTAKEDGRNVIVGLETEPGSGGKESTQATWRRLVGFHVKPIKPTQSKTGETRADAFSQQVNAGNVYICPGAWNEDYLEELRHFPHSTYKDQVDASSGAFTIVWVNKRHVGALWGKTPQKEVKPNGRPRTLVRGYNKYVRDKKGRPVTV